MFNQGLTRVLLIGGHRVVFVFWTVVTVSSYWWHRDEVTAKQWVLGMLSLIPQKAVSLGTRLTGPAPGTALFTAPLIVSSFAFEPFVAQIYIRLPPAARQSKEALFKWAATMSPYTEIQLVALRWHGGRRTCYTMLEHLYPLVQRGRRFANVARVGGDKPVGGWWDLIDRQQSVFNVFGKYPIKMSKAPGIWQIVMKRIEQKPPKDIPLYSDVWFGGLKRWFSRRWG